MGVREADSGRGRARLAAVLPEESFVEIKIGIQNVTREVTVDTEASSADIEKQLTQALTDGGVLTIVDPKGRKVIVPAAAVAYLDLGQEKARPVGFGLL